MLFLPNLFRVVFPNEEKFGFCKFGYKPGEHGSCRLTGTSCFDQCDLHQLVLGIAPNFPRG